MPRGHTIKLDDLAIKGFERKFNEAEDAAGAFVAILAMQEFLRREADSLDKIADMYRAAAFSFKEDEGKKKRR